MTSHPFTRNYSDHSNDQGFQFEFFCDKCGNGHRSSFRTNTLGVASSLLKAVGNLVGSNVGYSADHVKDAFRGGQWDSAYQEAMNEIRPRFHHCTRCGKWVCGTCWNEKRALCEDCAPDTQEEAASIQAQVAVEQLRERARQTDQTQQQDMASPQQAACGHCNARLHPGARFCAACGKPTVASPAAAASARFCTSCGAKMPGDARFCSGCGTAMPTA